MTVEGPDVRTPSPLEEVGLLEESQIYRAMFVASNGNVTPPQVDELEIWEIAVLLGMAEPDAEDSAAAVASTAKSNSQLAAERARQRMLAAEGLAPMPEANPIDPATLMQLTGALNGGP